LLIDTCFQVLSIVFKDFLPFYIKGRKMLFKVVFLASLVMPHATTKFKANDFACLDDTRFMHFVDPVNFFVKSCPSGLCFTRKPPAKNPCIGKDRAIEIDGL
jgi:hypothetical protein